MSKAAIPDKAYTIALRLLSQREHSRHELANKLIERGINKTTITVLLAKLVEKDWLNEERYASMLLRTRIQQNYGPMRIRFELSAQSIDRTLIDETLATAETDWFTNACNARIKRFGVVVPEVGAERHKQIKFLLRRGFDMEHCRFAITAVDTAG